LAAKFTIAIDIENGGALAKLNQTGGAMQQMAAKGGISLQGIGTKITALSFGFNQVTQAVQTVARVMDAPIQAFTGFETKMANVKSLGVTNLKELESGVLKLTGAIPKSAEELSASLYDVVSAGVNSANQLQVLELSAKAATAGLADTSDALNLSSAVVKGYGLEWDATEGILDQAFQTVKLGQTTFPELSKSIGSVIPQAAALKIESEELFGSFATLTGVTGNASEVATQLKGVMTGLAKPTADLTKLAINNGYATVEQMVAAEGLQGTLGILKEATGGSAAEMGKLFGSVEATTALLALSGNNYDEFTSKTEQMTASTGAMNQAFIDNSQTAENIEKIYKNQLNKTLIETGAALTPIKSRLQEMATEALERTGPGIAALAGHFANLALKLTESGLETAVRQLKEMGAAAEDLAALQGLIAMQDASEDLISANSRLESLFKNQAKIIDSDMLAAIDGQIERTGTVIHQQGQTLDGRKEEIRLNDASAISADKIREAIEKIQAANAANIEKLKSSDTIIKGMAQQEIEQNAEKIQLLTQALVIVQQRESAERVLLGSVESTTAAIQTQTTVTTNAVETVSAAGTSAVETATANAQESLKSLTAELAKPITIAPLEVKVLPVTGQLQEIGFEYQTFYDELMLKNELHLNAGLISGENYYEMQKMYLENYMQSLDRSNADEEKKYLQLLARKNKMDAQYFKTKEQLETQAVRTAIGLGDQLMGAAQGQNETLFRIGKGLAIANATINTIEAITKTMAAYPFPFNVGLAAIQGALGYAQVAQITSTQFRKMKGGGIIGDGSRVIEKGSYGDGENRLIIANDEEFIVNAEATANNKELLEYINTFRVPAPVQPSRKMASGGYVSGQTMGTPSNLGSWQDQEIIEKLEAIEAAVQGLQLRAEIDAAELAILVERGQEILLNRRNLF
jgi:TP901 family phage tail tape measure protein